MIDFLLSIIVRPFVWIFLPTKIIGKKFLKIVKKDSAIYSANHQTYNDPIIIKYRTNRKVKFMAKSELFAKKVNGWFFRTLGAYPVNRGGNDIESVKKTLRYLKDDNNIVIFPEGTRVKEGESEEYKNGLVFFAMKTDSYVVPMYFRKRTKVGVFNTLLIGKPFKFSEINKFKDKKLTKEILCEASNYLGERMNYLKTVPIKEYKKLIKEK